MIYVTILRAHRNTTRRIGDKHDQYRPASSIATRTRPHTVSAERSRSYVTHLIEAGRDPFFVQLQCGHQHASTTAIYTCVSSDFRTRTLRRALDDTLAAALGPRSTR